MDWVDAVFKASEFQEREGRVARDASAGPPPRPMLTGYNSVFSYHSAHTPSAPATAPFAGFPDMGRRRSGKPVTLVRPPATSFRTGRDHLYDHLNEGYTFCGARVTTRWVYFEGPTRDVMCANCRLALHKRAEAWVRHVEKRKGGG